MNSNSEKNIRYLLALMAIPGIGSVNARKLIAYAKGIENIFELKRKDLLQISGFGNHLVSKILEKQNFARADKELAFIQKYNIKAHSYFDDDYPFLLKQSEDCPLLFFSKGEEIDDEKKYLSIVGTRNATIRGIEFCQQLIKELKERNHNVCIVSGLAFGVDIAAHKAALENGLSTIAVLAHGLDTIYPSEHRKTASEIVQSGTLVSEFFSQSFADKNNFVRRNRIIAGLSEATVVVESDKKGGALITAELANSYNREVFAVPGRVNDKYSLGCNHLIKTHRASLLQSVEDIEYLLSWEQNKKPKQKKLFVELSAEEQILMNTFDQSEEQNIDVICRKSGFTISKVSAMLLNLEFMGLIRCLPGKIFTKKV